MTDTIVALSSGRPPAAIAVVRVSGAHALAAARALAGDLPPPRRAGLRALRRGGELLDRALVLAFPGPRSATGEDLVELHLHGGRAVVAAVEAALLAQPMVRAAESGEFTRRALANGRIDLAQAEGLADLLAAETEGARRAAVHAAEGGVSRLARDWLDRLTAMAARVEAALDFADEGDVGEGAAHGVESELAALRAEMAALLAQPPAERLRDGVRVVLAGPPNAGKSTLLNLLTARDAAIVSPVAGTTRDVVEAGVTRGGVAYLLQDTAGLADSTADPVEAIGVARARRAAAAADLLLWLGDDPAPPGAVALHARADLPGRGVLPAGRALAVSARDPASVEALWRLIEARAAALVPVDRLAWNRRQRACAETAAAALVEDAGGDLLLLAEQLRAARVTLAGVTGAEATEAMLDALFGRFCVGK